MKYSSWDERLQGLGWASKPLHPHWEDLWAPVKTESWGGEGVSHTACEWEPDGAEFACLGPLAMSHGASTPFQHPAGLCRAWRLNAACMRVPGCACLSVCGVEEGCGGQEREALTLGGKDWVWKGVKALDRKILAGMLHCPLLASAGSAGPPPTLTPPPFQEPAFSF